MKVLTVDFFLKFQRYIVYLSRILTLLHRVVPAVCPRNSNTKPCRKGIKIFSKTIMENQKKHPFRTQHFIVLSIILGSCGALLDWFWLCLRRLSRALFLAKLSFGAGDSPRLSNLSWNFKNDYNSLKNSWNQI